MITTSLAHIMDVLHAQFCYQVFITPIPFPLEREYRDFAKLACELLEGKRTEVIHEELPRHHVLHHFIPAKKSNGKKILITHGWMSRAAYMMTLTDALHQQGYEVFALDFPAHGEAKGIQLPWIDAVTILKETINQHGPFYGIIGHSFGGSMVLNTLNIAGQYSEWRLNKRPERVIMLASPTQMRNPVTQVAKKLKLSGRGYQQLRHLIEQQAKINLRKISLHYFVNQMPDIPFLCIHGELDETVNPKESIMFCKKYPKSNLHILPDINHVNILMDKRVTELVCDFLM